MQQCRCGEKSTARLYPEDKPVVDVCDECFMKEWEKIHGEGVDNQIEVKEIAHGLR